MSNLGSDWKWEGKYTLHQLSNKRMLFGVHSSKRFDEIPLKYLESIVDAVWLWDSTKDKIEAYLNHPLTLQAREMEKG